jgi:RNA polymerase subunit RPABC4/transcription elongation factor Spt4
MNCERCRRPFERDAKRCPHCGKPQRESSGVFQTSTVLISTGGSETVYRSVQEVPAGLRRQLMKSTNGGNSATILIADRRGRQEIARAMRRLPGKTQRRLIQSILGTETGGTNEWLTPARKHAVLAVITAFVLAVIAAALTSRW